MNIRNATAVEATSLGDLAFVSKAYWGYSDEFMALCKDDLQVSPDSCSKGLVKVAEHDEKLLGYYRLSCEVPATALCSLHCTIYLKVCVSI
jgi:hypothetical protein